MKKRMIPFLIAGTLLCGLTACAGTASANPTQEAAAGLLKISMNFQRSGTIASNQYAVWVEDEAGTLIKTLYASDFTASGGYAQRKESISTWVAKANPSGMGQAEIDAVSGPSPQSGRQELAWDGTDAKGVPVPEGNYRIYVEGTLYWPSTVLYSGSFHLGGESASVTMTAAYTEPDNEQNRDMLTDVTAEYVAGTSSTEVTGENGMKQTRNELGALSPEAALEYMKNTPNLVIVDVAATRWYNEEHFEHAMNIPIEELDSGEEDARYLEIPSGRPVLLHCRRGMIVPGAYRRVLELRADIPEISYIDGTPPFAEYNEWLAAQAGE